MTARRDTIGIAGAGRFGTALGSVLARAGRRVVLWSRDAEVVDAIRATRRCPRLPGAPLPEPLEATGDPRRLAGEARFIVLAVTSTERAAMLPDVPTMAEAGLPGYDMPAWRSIMGPAGMPRDVVAILNKGIQQALASPELRERYIKAGSNPEGSTPEELRKRYELWMGIFEKIAKNAGVKPQ